MNKRENKDKKDDKEKKIRIAIAQNKSVSAKVLNYLSDDEENEVGIEG